MWQRLIRLMDTRIRETEGGRAMKLTVHFEKPGCADGIYQIRGRGYLAAELFWSNENGILEDYTAFACIPLGLGGEGVFHFRGGRAIPPEASSVTARAVDGSLTRWEEASTPIPMDFRRFAGRVERKAQTAEENVQIVEREAETAWRKIQTAERNAQTAEMKVCIMSDLHLTNKAGRLKWALGQAKGADLVLLLGDLVNDGLPEQFQLFSQCLEEALPDTPVLAVAGNHDFPRYPLPLAGEKRGDFLGLFEQMAQKAESLGVNLEMDPRGGFCAQAGGIQIIGLHGAGNWRKLRLEKDGQLAFLEESLRGKSGGNLQVKQGWNVQGSLHENPEPSRLMRLILCHAPLLNHNPQRKQGQSQPYFGGDRALQELLDGQENFLFLSGHTHLSPNLYQGCAEILPGNRIYMNVGSTCPCEMKTAEPLVLEEWREPVMTELIFDGDAVSLVSRSLVTGKKFARGYYRQEGGSV